MKGILEGYNIDPYVVINPKNQKHLSGKCKEYNIEYRETDEGLIIARLIETKEEGKEAFSLPCKLAEEDHQIFLEIKEDITKEKTNNTQIFCEINGTIFDPLNRIETYMAKKRKEFIVIEYDQKTNILCINKFEIIKEANYKIQKNIVWKEKLENLPEDLKTTYYEAIKDIKEARCKNCPLSNLSKK